MNPSGFIYTRVKAKANFFSYLCRCCCRFNVNEPLRRVEEYTTHGNVTFSFGINETMVGETEVSTLEVLETELSPPLSALYQVPTKTDQIITTCVRRFREGN